MFNQMTFMLSLSVILVTRATAHILEDPAEHVFMDRERCAKEQLK